MLSRRSTSILVLSLCLCKVAVAQSSPPTIVIDSGVSTCTGPGSATQVQCYVNNPTLTVTWTVSPDSPCTAPNCHIEYCLSTTAPVSGYLACGHQWQHKKAAQSFPLPNTNATYSVYGEYKVIRAAAVGPDTAAKSTASTPFYVTLNTGAPS